MWTCQKCSNENSETAGYCAYCGSTKAGSLESERDISTKFQNASSSAERRLSLAANPDFPVTVPSLLRLSEAAIRAIAAVIGIAAGIACSLVIYLLANPTGMTGRLFNLREPFAVVPVLILIMFFWGLGICVLRFFRISVASRVCSSSLLLDSMQVANLDGLLNLSKDLASTGVQCSPLLRRLQALTTHWSITPNLQDADVLLQQQTYSDEEEVRSGYSLVRTFIWALPVIGLLGTVAGVAVAVGGFAEFLGGDIEDVAVIKRSLVNVTSGLSYAFLTTLYGLATALILMLLATSLQTREEKLYSAVQQKVTNLFLPFLQKISPERKGEDVGSLSGLQEQLMKISKVVLDYVRQQGSLTLQSFNDERNILRDNVVEWGQLLREQSTAGAHDIGQALDRVGIKISNSQFEFLQRFESIKSEMDNKAASVLHSTGALAESVSVRQQHMLEGISEQNAIVQRNADVLLELSKLSREALDQNLRMNKTLATLTELNLEERAKDIVQIMESHKKEIEASVSALAQNSALTGEVLAAQTTLHDSITKLHQTGLVETLREFRNSLTDLKPVLENLREPFILQAIPVNKDRMPS